MRPVSSFDGENFFSINALHPSFDLNPTEPYHSPERPRRADHNVVCYRNFLVEMDSGSLHTQMDLIRGAELPWSTCVYSGGKSLHFIVSLEDALANRAAYTEMARRIYRALKCQMAVDPANKNPSRLSRCPGAHRPEKSSIQLPIEVRERVPNRKIEEWLLASGMTSEAPALPGQATLLLFPETRSLSRSTREFLMSGAPAGQWNHSLFRAACDLFNSGVSLAETTARLQQITGVLDRSDLATIQSAYRRVSA